MELESNYLISYLKGGLGNRLFMIASTYGLSTHYEKL